MTAYEVGRQAIFEKRADYWGTPAYLDKLHYIDVGTDITTQIAALSSGQIDIIYRASITDTDLIKRLPNLKLLTASPAQTIVMRMQVDKKPFDDIRVRARRLLAADNAQMLAVAYRGEGTIADDFHVAPMQPHYFGLPP